MWEILSENALGLVLLVDAQSLNPVQDMLDYLEGFRALVDKRAMRVGITHAENMPWDLHQNLSDTLIQRGIPANIIPVDARDKSQMAQLVSMLIYAIE